MMGTNTKRSDSSEWASATGRRYSYKSNVPMSGYYYMMW